MIHPEDLEIIQDAVRVVEAHRAWSATLQNLCVTCGHTKAWHGLDGPWCDSDCPCEHYLAMHPEPAYPV